jgi:hypothetical protein
MTLRRISTKEAWKVVDFCRGGGDAVEAQALHWAGRVAKCNARNPFSDWDAGDFLDTAESGPDLIRYLGHNTPEGWLESQP